MSLSDAIFFAALVTIVCAIGIAEKIIDVDMDQFLPENLKKAKIKRIFVERNTPLQGTNVQKEIKKAFESVLLPLGKADKNLLPKRMDMTFRRKMDHQINLLRKRKLCRDIRLTDVMPLPKNNFKRWNDDGGNLFCSAVHWSGLFLQRAAKWYIRSIGKAVICVSFSQGISAILTARVRIKNFIRIS